MQTTPATMMPEDFGEGFGKVPQQILDYFHELEEENMQVFAIKNTKTHCKGITYTVSDADGTKGIQEGVFQNAVINAIIAQAPEQQETYYSNGSDKETKAKKK